MAGLYGFWQSHFEECIQDIYTMYKTRLTPDERIEFKKIYPYLSGLLNDLDEMIKHEEADS